MIPERRRSPRVPLIAHADVTDVSSDTKLSARVSELSLYGCYFDMINPFPFDTAVRVEILHGGKTFKSAGKVIYTQPNMGMGVAFSDVSAENQAILESWVQALEN